MTAPMLFCMLCLLPACGYQLGRSGGLPSGITRIRIPPIENPTTETELSAILTNDLINEFIKNGYAVTPRIDESDAGLVGRIAGVKTRTISRVGDHTALERRVEISTAFEFADKTGEIRWTRDISESETYAVSGDENTTATARRAAIITLSKRLSEKIFASLADRY